MTQNEENWLKTFFEGIVNSIITVAKLSEYLKLLTPGIIPSAIISEGKNLPEEAPCQKKAPFPIIVSKPLIIIDILRNAFKSKGMMTTPQVFAYLEREGFMEQITAVYGNGARKKVGTALYEMKQIGELTKKDRKQNTPWIPNDCDASISINKGSTKVKRDKLGNSKKQKSKEGSDSDNKENSANSLI